MKSRYPIALVLGALRLFAPFPVPAVETTTYVNNYFEIRDHNQPTKYVFNGATRVARVTGSLSTNIRIQRLRLYAGWNLCSVAVDRASLPSRPEIVTAYHWNSASDGWEPLAADAFLSAGGILWFHAATNFTLTLTGAYSDPTNAPIVTGGSFYPSTGLEALPLLGEGVDVGTDLALWHFDSSSKIWRMHLPLVPSSDQGFPGFLAPGSAIYVHAEFPAELQAPDPTLRIRYYHEDHLGSSSVITDAAGALVEETTFYPFGAARNEYQLGRVEESYKFTQKERDEETGLHYFGRRFYSPAIGKWLSTDPLEERGGSLNLYSYVKQNPLKYHDPDGAEIKVKESGPANKRDYQIHVSAALLNKDKNLSSAEVRDYAARLKTTIEKSFTGKEGKTTWTTTVDLRVINDWSDLGVREHVFLLAEELSGRGEASTFPGMLMKIKGSTLQAARPEALKDSKHYELHRKLYKSPESTGAHELGHTMGLPDLATDTSNLMSHGREYGRMAITRQQIETIGREFKQGNLNQREDLLKEKDQQNQK